MSSLSIHGFHVFPNSTSSHYFQSQSTTPPITTVNLKLSYNSSSSPMRSKRKSLLVIVNSAKEEKKASSDDVSDSDPPFDPLSVERPPYYSYMDSISGQMEPASGARASIPGQDYWPEGTASRVRAARAPKPSGKSTGEPSYGKNPGSRRGRKKQFANVAASEGDNAAELAVIEDSEDDEIMDGSGDDGGGVGEAVELSNEFVVYQDGQKDDVMTEYEFNKSRGNPHPFIDPNVKREIKEPLTSEELWWNWKKPDKEQWSRWQRRRPDSETVFVKAMAASGQIKIYGDHPTLTETSLYRSRRHLFKEERLQAEHERLEDIGPLAYYSEWVEAWKRDTSKEAVQKHFEETGEDENTQLIEMFQLQTDREYRIMMGTDIRVRRDPLAMRMREDQIKEIWGGDPVYPTINYIQDPDEIIDYRGPEFHEPTPNMLSYLMEEGKIISRDDLEQILAKEKTEELEVTDIDEAMARAVDIGENDDEGEDSEVEEEADEKLPRNWSVLKSSPELQKSKGKAAKKETPLSLDDAIDESENLTDFLLDFNEDE